MLFADRRFNLAIVVKNLTNPAYVTALKAADDAALRYGLTVTKHAPETPDSTDEQSALIERLIDDPEVDGIVFTPVDTKGQVPLLERAREAGKALYNFSNMVEGGEIVSFVGCDDLAIGHKQVEWLAGQTSEARILLLEGAPGVPTGLMRLQGATEELAKHGGLRVLASERANMSRQTATDITPRLLEAHPEADTLLALNDEMALGAISVLEAAGRLEGFRVLGVNGTPDGLLAIKAGKLDATVDYALYAIVTRTMELAVRHLNGERIDEQMVMLPVRVFDSTNIDEAIAERQAWGVM
jgi:ribose transport system substrate-binding protein